MPNFSIRTKTDPYLDALEDAEEEVLKKNPWIAKAIRWGSLSADAQDRAEQRLSELSAEVYGHLLVERGLAPHNAGE